MNEIHLFIIIFIRYMRNIFDFYNKFSILTNHRIRYLTNRSGFYTVIHETETSAGSSFHTNLIIISYISKIIIRDITASVTPNYISCRQWSIQVYYTTGSKPRNDGICSRSCPTLIKSSVKISQEYSIRIYC